MQGSTIKYLAKVCELARVDIDPNAPLLLTGMTDSLAAHYRGQYSSAYRTVESDAGELDVIVAAKQFKDMASLLDNEEEVKLSETERGLLVRSKSSRFELRAIDRNVEPLTFPDPNAVINFKRSKKRGSFQEEVDLAAKFVAKNLARPVFTGIHIIFAEQRLGLEASDGFGMIYRSQLRCKGPGKTQSVVVPTFDFQLGLQITGDDDLSIGIDESKIYLVGNGAGFDCVLQTGKWPALDLPAATGISHIEMTAPELRRAIAAVRLLDGKMDLHFAPSKRGGVRLRTKSETGEFAAAVRGSLHSAVAYDADALAMIADIGDELSFEIPQQGPLHVQLGNRHAWLLERT